MKAEQKKKTVVGILAHVDAGKTTLSEAMLYLGGVIRRVGRVDHADAFLDNYALERERGITIFSKQAVIELPHTVMTLIDTPGHVDFSAETERTLQVLDYAILVISGTDGVQGHTVTLWKLLERYNVPTFLFINKMDLPGARRSEIMNTLRSQLSEGCVEFPLPGEEGREQAALCDEELFSLYSEGKAFSDANIASAVTRRSIFPCCFGSALKLDGVEEFISCLERYTVMPEYPAEFGARVFKISRDEKGARLTHMKITGGSIRVKDTIPGNEDLGKIEQIRIYSGAKFTAVEQAQAGTVCAVTGLVKTRPFDVYGAEKRAPSPVLLPVMTYRLDLPEGENVHEALSKLRQLQEEEPELHIVWHERLREIHVQLMGKMQLDIVKDMILRRFGMEVSFGQGSVLYAETIQDAVEGVGHFEPLRHYAEVHLILTPLERGQGLVFDTECPEDALDRNWQRLVLTHLAEKTHLGVLTGSPITDMRITLAAGRAHLKHTEGGDFRQATYRAVRNALMRAKSVLLEPYYSFTLELPRESVGRAMTDIQQMGGQIQPPEDVGDTALLTGRAPAVCLADYAEAVNIYTKGAGRLTLMPDGYDVCHNSQEVIDGAGYDPRADLENTPDSVFCYHGSAETVSWDEVPRHMHIPFVMQSSREPEEPSRTVRREVTYSGTYEEDRELQRIFEMTYGQSKSTFLPRRQEHIPTAEDMLERTDVSDEYLLVDGYNVIHSWQELRQIAQESLDLARQALINVLSNYQGYTGKNVILVFDAYKVAGAESIEKHGGLFVVYTKESEIADVFIEKVTKRLGRELKDKYRVRVVTSDGLEQCITLAHGALRVPASSFEQEVEQVTGEIRRAIEGRK